MKIIVFLSCALLINATASVYSQNTQFTFSVEGKTIKDVFRIIEKESQFRFLYNDDFTDLNQKVTINVKDNRIESILDKMLDKSEITYRILANNLIVITPVEMVQSIAITGIVIDQTGETLPGVNVMVKGTNIGVISAFDGRYSVTVPNNDAVLVFSFVGYITQEIAVAGRQVIDVTLSENVSQLEEVVVVGYAVQKKVNLSGAVQAVSGRSIENRPVANVNRGLQGLVPNLNITNSSGRTDAAPGINIRGYTSINGGGAFILVDNVPVTNEELSRLNPADVDNVSVLKDAASAAIYGARAAFGVVLITTKKATSQALQVNFNNNVAIRDRGIRPGIVTNVLESMELKQAAREPLSAIFTQAQLDYARQLTQDPSLPRVRLNPSNPNLWDYYGETDWIDEAYRKRAPALTSNINISKKGDDFSYYISGGLYSEDGLLNYGNDQMNRYNFRGKADMNLTNWWKLGTNMSFVNSHYDSPTFLDGYFNWNVNRTPANNIPRNPDGTWTQAGSEILGALESGGRRIDRRNETQVSVNTQIDLVKDVWTVNADANFRRSNFNRDQQNLSVSYRRGPNEPLLWGFGERGISPNNVVFAMFRAEESKYSVYNLYTNFTKTFVQKHFLNLMLGYNRELFGIRTYTTTKPGLISQSMPEINLATGDPTATNSVSELAVDGFFGRINYIYDNRYIFEANGRYDGSSRFPKGSRYGFFPSFSAAWVISRESFFKGISETLSISNLKIRGSYGSLGNQSLNSYYPYLPTMGNAQIGQILDNARPQSVTQPGVVSNSLTWEQVRTVNGGMDIGLFNNRFDLSFDIYTRFTEGMLTAGKTLPSVFGATEPQTNAADLKTKGWELTVSYRDYFKLMNDRFNWSFRFMLADYRTWITKFDNENKLLSNYYAGQRIGEIWGLITDGFFQSDEELTTLNQTAVGEDDNNFMFYVGDTKYKDLNNDGFINYGNNTVDNPGDRKIIGNSEIRLPLGFELTADWKGFDLRAFFQGVGKRDWYPSASSIYFWGIYAQPWTNPTKKNLDRWTPEKPYGYFPRLKSYAAEDLDSDLGAAQTKYLQSTAYLRLKNLTLGYSLPKTMVNKLHVEQFRIYFSAENVFTLSGIVKGVDLDPEIANSSYSGFNSGVYPMQRTYSFGVNLTF